MRLVSIQTREILILPGLRLAAHQTLKIGEGSIAKWRVHVRGPAVFLESPPMWTPASATGGPKGAPGSRTVFELPRDLFSLTWSLDEGESVELDGKLIATHSSPAPREALLTATLRTPQISESRAPDSENSDDSRVQVVEVRKIEGPFDDRPDPQVEPMPELEAVEREQAAEAAPAVTRRKRS